MKAEKMRQMWENREGEQAWLFHRLGRRNFCFGILSWLWQESFVLAQLITSSPVGELCRILGHKARGDLCWFYICYIYIERDIYILKYIWFWFGFVLFFKDCDLEWAPGVLHLVLAEHLGNVHLLLLTWNQREKQEGFLEHGPGLVPVQVEEESFTWHHVD